MKNVKLLITDLDDTIWDWLSMWYNSFNPYFNRIQKECGISKNDLLRDFKDLHRKYHTTEVSYAFKELKSIKKDFYNIIENDQGENPGIMHQYYQNKKDSIKLYPQVLKTLRKIKSEGTRIIGFTESNIFYTKYRIKTLQIDGLFDIIYSPEDHVLPESIDRYYDYKHWDLKHTKIRTLPNKFQKPDSKILLNILQDNNATVYDAIYIGDKLDRDIYMANKINLTSIYAKYGNVIDSEAYELLKLVTHWSRKDVKREIASKKDIKRISIEPDYIIYKFEELLNIFKFTNYTDIYQNSFTYDDSDKKNIIDIWKGVVEVQKHFNDIEIRIRNFAITIFTFIIGGIALCIKENFFLHKFGLLIPIATLVAFIGILVIAAIYFMDRHWYHRLLQAAVSKGMKIEKSFSNIYPEIALTSEIKTHSPYSIFLSKIFSKQLHSDQKLRIFYLMLIFPFILSFVITIFYSNDLLLNNELNYIKKNTERLYLNTINSLPHEPGLIIIIEKNGKLYCVKETDDLQKCASSFKTGDSIMIKSKNVYYSKTRIARKELEELIREQGVNLNR
jgi:phosphoglycolate phosphatase-like HAD superfamily hydrolase